MIKSLKDVWALDVRSLDLATSSKQVIIQGEKKEKSTTLSSSIKEMGAQNKTLSLWDKRDRQVNRRNHKLLEQKHLWEPVLAVQCAKVWELKAQGATVIVKSLQFHEFYFLEFYPFSRGILEKNSLMLPAEVREKEPPWNMLDHSVLNKVSPQKKLFNQSLTYLEKGKYPVPAYSSHPVSLRGGGKKTWDELVKFIVQRHRLTKRVIPNRRYRMLPLPYHSLPHYYSAIYSSSFYLELLFLSRKTMRHT